VSRARAPLEIRLIAVVFGVGGLLFVSGALVWAAVIQDFAVVTVPVADALVGLAAAACLVTGLWLVRWPAMVWATLVAVVQAVLALGAAPVWLRALCGLLAVAHVYALVLLNTAPARAHLGGTP